MNSKEKQTFSGARSGGAVRHKFKCVYPRRANADIVNMLPITSFKGEIVLVDTEAALEAALPEIASETLLGFDTETRPNFSPDKHFPVSILQLGGEKKVWIVRLEPLKNRLADIYEILENPAIKKVGVAVNGDIISLRKRMDFSPAAFEDIAKYTRGIGVINTGMKNLAAIILGERVSKAAQLTNWASPSLTKKQLEYAATDAWISRRLYLGIKEAVENTDIILEPETPPASKFSLRAIVSNILGKISSIFPKKPSKPSTKKKHRGKRGGKKNRGGKKRSEKKSPQSGSPAGEKQGG